MHDFLTQYYYRVELFLNLLGRAELSRDKYCTWISYILRTKGLSLVGLESARLQRKILPSLKIKIGIPIVFLTRDKSWTSLVNAQFSLLLVIVAYKVHLMRVKLTT